MTANMEETITENQRVGLEVRAWMVRKQLKQADLAQILGFAQKNVSNRLRGQMPFRIDELMTIASYMDITLGQLLGEEIVNEKNPHPMDGGSSTVAGGRLDLPTSRL
ncbi:helix-turn-helix transcriptional regulator [Brevibacterium sp. 239c]|uniref:helix-turn-helix domain-containing protein n=1 Tax=Brevibacterium sp. 239c TaxID=1965356 RepID=UPI000C7707AF